MPAAALLAAFLTAANPAAMDGLYPSGQTPMLLPDLASPLAVPDILILPTSIGNCAQGEEPVLRASDTTQWVCAIIPNPAQTPNLGD